MTAKTITLETAMSTERETALVTGASSGLGTEFARILAARGCDLILVARRAEKLEELAASIKAAHPTKISVIVHDLSQPHAADTLWEKITKAGHQVDILVNNAGVGLSGALAECDAKATEAMLDLDVTALTMLCRHALPDMLKRRQGRILNVASLTGYQGGGPGMAVYYAAKAYVLSLTCGLAGELRGTGVTATALCPGPTRTEWDSVARAGNLRMFRWLPLADPRGVAESGINAMFAGRAVEIPGFVNKILAFLGQLPPRRISVEVNRMLLRP
jgi:short-subunit dehydrogenase